MKTCPSCGTDGQPDSASFCMSCGGTLADPVCSSCGNELPPAARFCMTCGTPRSGAAVEPQPPEAVPARGAARKITSVLFGDLVGFTTLSESRDAEEVRELLTAYFDECRAVVGRYGGELEKFIGDAVMAVWGLPLTREDDAERAVRAGLELVERVTALGERIGMPGLAMRVGITTAEVAVTLGATGQGMVAGDAVNTAARIQSTAPPGEVWVDETTHAFTTTSFAYEDAGAHSMKGKAEPVPLWAVRAVLAGDGSDRSTDGLEAPLVGRDRELRLVKEVFHGVQESHRPGLLVVDGEPGVGKTRLAWEFETYIDGLDADVLWHRGRCLSYGEGVAYYALAEAVRSRVAVLAGDDGSSDEDPRHALERALNACVPDAVERDWLEPRLAALLGIETTTFPKEDLFVAWTAFLKYVGQARSSSADAVVLVVDDAQYADEGLLAFLEHLLAAADFPVFVLVLARPELMSDHPALAGNRRVTVVHLEPLPAADMARLVDGLVGGVPEALRDEFVARAEGIPLYAVEMLRSLVDQDLVVGHGGRYRLVDPEAVDAEALSAPATLQALLAARLDTLPADERLVIDRASVLGLAFTAEGIAALCPDVPDLDQALTALFRREVLRRDNDRLSADFGSYRFVQGAVRQVAYGMLSRRDRKAIHLTVAHTFETELESHPDAYELESIVAQHYLDAIDAVPGDPDIDELTRAASGHLEQAAERAAALGAPREAAGHLAKALDRCEPERRLVVQSKLARELRKAGEHAAAIEHAGAAMDGLVQAGDVLAASKPTEDLALALAYSATDLNRAQTVLREQLARLPETPETLPARVALVGAQGNVLVGLGDREELSRTAQELMRLAELGEDPRQVADSWILYAISCLHTTPRLSVALLRQASELAAEHRCLREHGVSLVNLSAFSCYDDVAAGISFGRDAVAASRELGEEYVFAFARSNLAYALLLDARLEEAAELAGTDDVRSYMSVTADLMLRLVHLARQEEWPPVAETLDQDPESMDDQVWLSDYGADRALEAHAGGHPDAAAMALDAVRLSHQVSAGTAEFWMIWLVATEIARDLGDHEALVEMLSFVSEQNGPWPAAIRAQRSRLRALVGQAESMSTSDVEDFYRDALEKTIVWGSTLYEAHVCTDYGQWLLGEGRDEEGTARLERARVVYEGAGARHWLGRLER